MGEPADQALSFDIGWDWVPANQRHGREAFYSRFLPFKGGKKHQPQDAYCLRCMPQVHGAVRDAWAQACRVIDIELNSVTDNPLIFPDAEDAQFIEEQVISAGHFHGMPLALGDELREGGDSGAGFDFRASPQQAGRSRHQRRPAGFSHRQRGRHRFRLHDRAVHRRGAGERSGHARASGQRVFACRPVRMRKTMCRWGRTKRATCWR